MSAPQPIAPPSLSQHLRELASHRDAWLVIVRNFIPVVGILLQPVLAALYGSFVLSLDFSDPTFERHLPRFRDRVGYIGRHKARYLGFGLTAVAMALVPIVNFLLLPVGVAAAAMLYLEGEEVIVGISHDE